MKAKNRNCFENGIEKNFCPCYNASIWRRKEAVRWTSGNWKPVRTMIMSMALTTVTRKKETGPPTLLGTPTSRRMMIAGGKVTRTLFSEKYNLNITRQAKMITPPTGRTMKCPLPTNRPCNPTRTYWLR